MERKWIVLLIGFFMGLMAREAFAVVPSTELALFEEIPMVVTAAKREQSILEAPSAISVVTAEDIKQMGATSIDEALRMVPGVHFGYVTQSLMSEGGIRGFFKLPDNKIIFMVDGIPEQVESYGYPAPIASIALEEIERIEVMRGPGSSLYGANAMLGVINVITKKTKDTHGNLVSFTGGERGLLMGTYMHGGSIKDKLDYRFTFSGEKKDNWGYIDYARDPTVKYWRGNLMLDYYIDNNSQLNFRGSYYSLRDSTTIFESTGPLIFGGGNDNVYTVAMTYTSKKPNIMLRAYQHFMNHWKRGFIFDAVRGYQFLSGTKGVDFQDTLEPFKKDTLVWGGNYMQQEYLSPATNSGKHRHDMNGIFLDNTYKLMDKFHINTGARYDKHPNTANTLSHRVSFLYFPWKDQSFRFTWSSSYRNPDFVESYYNTATVVGHEDNKAEKAENFELGYRGKVTKKLNVEANVFYTRVMDYIYFVSTTATRKDFLNIDDLFEQGMEIELKYAFTNWLEGVLNYTYLNQWPQQDMGYLEATSSVLSMTPQNILNGQLRAYFKNGLSANLELHYCGATDWRVNNWATYFSTYRPAGTRTIGGGKAARYIIADLHLGYKFKLANNDAELGLAIFDMFDKQYDDYPIDTTSVGRRITGSFTYKF